MPANAPYDAHFWKDEVARAERKAETYHADWQATLNHYCGKAFDDIGENPINTNTIFQQIEQKSAQLFYATPDLQLTPGQGFESSVQGMMAFRALLMAVLGADHMDALRAVKKAIKGCTVTAGFGPTLIGYQPTMQMVAQPAQPGAVLGLTLSPEPTESPVAIHELFYWETIPPKKFLVPADFASTEFDKAPWLGMRFRIPFNLAKQLCNLPADFTGTQTKDDKVLEGTKTQEESTGLAYVDGILVWYKASLFDDDVIHPEVYRRHLLIEGVDGYADKTDDDGATDPQWASPYQDLGPDNRLTADSMRGNPIHIFTLRDVPDSAYVPSDARMLLPLVKEKDLFRTQMVRERDVNQSKFGYKASVFPPTTLTALEQAMTGSLIPLPDDAFSGGLEANFVEFGKSQQNRQTYVANDYIERDIQSTLGLGKNQAGLSEDESATATEIQSINRALDVRLDAERNEVLRGYLSGVDKVAALILRFMTDPRQIAEKIGPQAAQAYLQWRSVIMQSGDPRPKFTAKADSQIRLDAAQERSTWLKVYNFAAKDPMVNRGAILTKLFTLLGEDPMAFVGQMPEQKPDPSLGFSFKGEDLNPLMPQQPITIEILAQCGIDVSQLALAEAKAGAANQVLMQQLVAAETSAKASTKKPQEHGGTAPKMGPLNQHQADATGERSGPKTN